jgi:hypothetical protein
LIANQNCVAVSATRGVAAIFGNSVSCVMICRFQATRRNLLRNFQRLYNNDSKPLEAEGFLRVSWR